MFGPFDTTGVLKAISNAQLYKILVSTDQPDRPGYVDPDPPAGHPVRPDQAVGALRHLPPGRRSTPASSWRRCGRSIARLPAFKEGTTCQDCHMSPSPGQKVGFTRGPAALVNGLTVNDDRPLSDHTFVGPGYPISHPGLFPLRLDESRFTPQQWLKFDYRAKWGSDEFEKNVPASYPFPPEWQNAADRKKAWGDRRQANLAGGKIARRMRIKLLEKRLEARRPVLRRVRSKSARTSHSITS